MKTKEKSRESLERSIASLEQLISISRRLNSTLEMRPLLQQIVEAARELTNADGASILLLESDDSLRFAAASGPDAQLLEITEVPMDSSLAGWVVRNREMIIVEDVLSDPRHYAIQTIDPTQSLLAVPMFFGEQIIGVLESVTTKARHSFTREDIETLETLASIAAVAVQNARLFEQSDWVAEVVHEIRTPLTAILSYADLLQRPDLDDNTRIQFITIIQQETQRVNNLATQFLDLARLESGRVRMAKVPLNVADMIARAADIIRPTLKDSGQHLEIHILPDLPQTVGDDQRIHQVLLNLLSNAAKYSDPGDTITITARAEGQFIIVAVSDTGPGIPPEQLPRLFHKFARLPGKERKVGGTGLGLVISRQIIEAHKGQIWAESEVGKGSTFYFTLPIIEPGM
ncbi:MAG TPA: ATP-binding protein [Anaerolineae bacterium]|nr:ATP-binding protein [Anaerolineae bacterium]HQK14811.1 ATP-binding protein [Anaerolineae bacterium]